MALYATNDDSKPNPIYKLALQAVLFPEGNKEKSRTKQV